MNKEEFNSLIATLLEANRPTKSIAWLEAALVCKPRDPQLQADLARAYLFDYQIPEAIAQARKAYEMHPDHLATRYWLAQISALCGNYDEATAIITTFLLNDPNEDLFLGALGIAHGLAGYKAAARAVLKRIEDRSQDKMPYIQAQVLASLGDLDAAVDALEVAYDACNYSVLNLSVA